MVACIVVNVVQRIGAPRVGRCKIGDRDNKYIARVGQQLVADFLLGARVHEREVFDCRGTDHFRVGPHVFPG